MCVCTDGTKIVQQFQAAIASVFPRFVRLMANELYLWFSYKHLLYFPVFINFNWIKDKGSNLLGCNIVTFGVWFPMF